VCNFERYVTYLQKRIEGGAMLVNGADKFVRVAFVNEAEIEQVVQDFAEDLFGPNIIGNPAEQH
ncbi:MAG: hypothetical protein HOI62_16185, partial [Gemmatimonadales bacterium]|nr:hypothetical protein [Gemmatimonadales bacterium]